MKYCQDLRDRALNALERGEEVVSIAKRLEVSKRWVQRVKKRYEETGERSSLRMGGADIAALV